MTTTWTPLTQMSRRQWLLTNGEVLTEPDLEESPSGRKVRVKGTTLSAYSRDLTDLLQKAASQMAKDRGTQLWMSLDRMYETSSVGFDRRSVPKAQVNLIGNQEEPTILWWHFKHPDLPIEATLKVYVEGRSHWQVQRGYQVSMQTSLVWQSTELDDIRPYVSFMTDLRPNFSDSLNRVGMSYDDLTRWQAFVRDNPPIFETDSLGGNGAPNERVASKLVLKRLREFDSLSEIDIPDLRDLQNPAWLRLELFDTNVNAGTEQDLLDILDGEATVADALIAYKEFQTSMRRLGLVLEDRAEGDFMSALSGSKEPLTVQVQFPLAQGGGVDNAHVVSLHLPTGTVYVQCSNVHQDMNEVAEKWEEAQLIASLSGKEDELLAYAREYASRKGENVMKDLVASRNVED